MNHLPLLSWLLSTGMFGQKDSLGSRRYHFLIDVNTTNTCGSDFLSVRLKCNIIYHNASISFGKGGVAFLIIALFGLIVLSEDGQISPYLGWLEAL